MTAPAPLTVLADEMQRMKRLSMLLFFMGGGFMSLAALFLPTRDPPSAELGGVALSIFGGLLLLALLSGVVLWRRPTLALNSRLDAPLLLVTNACVVLAVAGETLLFRSQFSTMITLWPLVLAAGFMRRSLLWPQLLLSTVSLLTIGWLKLHFITDGRALVQVIETVVTIVPLTVTALCVSFFRQAALREAESLKRSMNTDFLTGLSNRRLLFHAFPQRQATLPEGQGLVVVLMDIDHFKTINDQYGHQVGDEVLQHFARSLKSHARAGELTARLGGEEFVWIIQAKTGENPAARVEAMRRHFSSQQAARGVTVSAGVVPASAMHNLTELLNIADKLLYQAKESGRNQVRMHAPPQAQPPISAPSHSA